MVVVIILVLMSSAKVIYASTGVLVEERSIDLPVILSVGLRVEIIYVNLIVVVWDHRLFPANTGMLRKL